MFFGVCILVTREMHVSALSKNEMLPAVRRSLFEDSSKMTSSEDLANLLCGFEVMAVDLFAIFATRMLAMVFPDTDTKNTCFDFANCLFLYRSSGSMYFTMPSENDSASIAEARESPLPEKITFFC